MKNFPASFAAMKNLKTGAAPVWILKITVAGVDYYLSDNAFTISPWGVTTKRWVKSWGSVTEGISGLIEEYKISDFSVTCLADPDASPNIIDLVLNNPIEQNVCILYFWLYGCSDPPQEMFRGYVRDSPISEGYTIVDLQLQDETLKWANTYVGKQVTLQDYPYADPDDVGKIMPLVYGSLGKFPALAIRAGKQTSLPNAVNATTTSVTVSDVTGFTVGMMVMADEEQMTVTGISGSTLTVTRGANGTLAAIHGKGAILWEQAASFDYLVAGHPVASIPKAYCKVGDAIMDISMLCTVWPAGDHPSYPGKAVLTIPGYVTIQQAVQLAIADGITVSNGTLNAVLGGNVTKTGTGALSGNVTKTGSATLSGDVTKTGSVDLTGDVTKTGSVTLSGLVELLGAVYDPGHTHTTGQSNSENSSTGLPTGQTTNQYNTVVYPSFNGGYGVNAYGLYIDFPADGARSNATYSITIKFVMTQTVSGGCAIFAAINGSTLQYEYQNFNVGGNIHNGDTFPLTFSTYSNSTNRVYIMTSALGFGYISVISASRTIQLTGLVSSANSAYVTKGSLAAGNGTLGTADTSGVTNTLDVIDGSGLSNTLGITDSIGVNNTLAFTDSIGIQNTLAANLQGNIAKSGTVSLTGNSVANTLVGDEILVDVVANKTAPGDVVSDILTTWCNVTNFRIVGTLPSSYAFNGAITDYRLARDIIHDLAWQCRCWFRQAMGSAMLVFRDLAPASLKTLAACRVQSGKNVHSLNKSEYGEVINTITLLYARDWTKSKGSDAYTGATPPGTDTASVGIYGVQQRPELFQFDFVTSDAMAADLLAFYLAYYGKRHWIHQFETFYYDAELEFADGVTLGFAGNILGQVEEVGFNPGSDTIQIKAVQ